MDFSLQPDTPEISAFRKEVREWLAENMRGSEHLRWSARWSTRENNDEYQFRRQLANKLGQKRWLFPTYPVQYGGAGLTLDHQFVLETEIDRYGLPLGSIFYTLARLVAPAVLKFGTEEQKMEFLPPMLHGELAVWQVLTEPQGGSDVAHCLTKAIRNGDEYVVNGQRSWSVTISPQIVSGLWSAPTRQENGTRTWAGSISPRIFPALRSSTCI